MSLLLRAYDAINHGQLMRSDKLVLALSAKHANSCVCATHWAPLKHGAELSELKGIAVVAFPAEGLVASITPAGSIACLIRALRASTDVQQQGDVMVVGMF